MKKIAAGEFKAHCLKIMDRVEQSREPVLITKKGRPVAKLVPADQVPTDVFSCLKGKMEIVGDIESPVIPAVDWKSLR